MVITAARVPLSKQRPARGQLARDIEVEWSVSESVGHLSDTVFVTCLTQSGVVQRLQARYKEG